MITSTVSSTDQNNEDVAPYGLSATEYADVTAFADGWFAARQVYGAH